MIDLDDPLQLQWFDRKRLLERASRPQDRRSVAESAAEELLSATDPELRREPLHIVLALPPELMGIGRAIQSALARERGMQLWLYGAGSDWAPSPALWLWALPDHEAIGAAGRTTYSLDVTAYVSADLHPAQVFLFLMRLCERFLPPTGANLGETDNLTGQPYWPAYCTIDAPMAENPAKQLAWQLHERVPLFWAGEALAGAAQDWSVRYLWYAESMALWTPISELARVQVMARLPRYWPNAISPVHLDHPGATAHESRLAYALDQLFSKRRMAATRIVTPKSLSLTSSLLYLLELGEWLALYAAALYNVDPSERVPLHLLSEGL